MNKNLTVGILGGGQLARMSALAAFRLGINISIFDKEEKSPAGSIANSHFAADIYDDNACLAFAKTADVITLENEFIDPDRLVFFERLGKKVLPSSKTISMIQDKYIQKKSFSKFHLPLPEYIDVANENDYLKIKNLLGLPFVLKSRKMGYDGYGNAIIKNEKEFTEQFIRLTGRHSALLAEKFIDFRKELAVMVLRTKKEILTYPVVETVQKNHICNLVIAPAEINKKQIAEAKEISIEAVKSVGGFGLFGVELFLTNKGTILINEIAPRPHNSGHYTIDACQISQFENHIRAVLGLPLGSSEMIKKYAVMINLLGKRNAPGFPENYADPLSNPYCRLHIYGKNQSRKGRKMGHITLIGDNLKALINQAYELEQKTII